MAEVRSSSVAAPDAVKAAPSSTISGTGPGQKDMAQAALKSRGLWADAFRRLLRNKGAIFGLFILLLLVFSAIFAQWIQRYPQDLQSFKRADWSLPPTAEHWLGTEPRTGRDVWSRVVNGSVISIQVGVIVQIIVLGLGVPLGLIAGFFGGWVDNLIMRIVDIFYAFPSLLLAMVMIAALGRSTFIIFLAVGIATWAPMARLVRGQVLSLREKEFVEAARAIGVKQSKIMWRHIFPNILGPIIISVSFGIPDAILTEAFLSFIGVGAPPPNPSWGQLATDYRNFISTYPLLILWPSLAITLTVLGLNFLGDGLRDALDPRSKNR
jgi:ABC-type dipeptide/oligopeptide/nickel transport system permease subunit